MTANDIRLRDALQRAGLVPFNPPVDRATANEWAEHLLEEMSDDEQFDLVVGDGFVIRANDRLGIPAIKLFDASQGVHLRDSVPSGKLHKTVAFPSMVSLAATWNRSLVGAYARSVGEECRAGGIHVLLGPGVNIYRIAQNGRNFEYTGEDPFLASEIVRIYVTALQQTGTMATVKHFIANNTDWCRRLSNSIVDRRALEEIYLPAFRSAVHAGTMAVMTSYNRLNGEYCGESDTVINGLLRDGLGFDGLVMTDWTSVTDGELVASSGQDLEMPEGEALQAKRKRLVGDPRIRRMAGSVLSACASMGFLTGARREMPEQLERFPEHEAVAYQTASEGIVLLKNDGVLPAHVHDGETVLVTGNWAVRTPISGKGSGYVVGFNQQSFLEAINAVAEGANVIYRADPSDEELENAALVFVFTGFETEGEGADRDFSLPADQDALISRAGSLNQQTVVSLVSGGGVAMPWHDSAAAILYTFFCGQQGAIAAADTLFGQINPSGKLPFTIEVDFADSPGAGYIPNGGRPEDRQPEGEHPLKPGPSNVDVDWPYAIEYEEGVFVGYRWYEKSSKPVRYWFGHGLSYTHFEYTAPEVREVQWPSATGKSSHSGSSAAGTPPAKRPPRLWKVAFSVRNTGDLPGAEVAQLYVSPPSGGKVGRPARELKGYEKLFLDPHEEKSATLYLTEDDFACFDENAGEWTVEPGEYTLHLGASYVDVRRSLTVTV